MLLLKGIKCSNKKTYTSWFVPGFFNYQFVCMPNFPDLSERCYFFYDKGGHNDLYSIIKILRHIFITSHIKGQKYKMHGCRLEIYVLHYIYAGLENVTESNAC